MFLPNHVQIVLDKLAENGYEAYVVGGAVRDALLGRKVNDYDVTTSAKTSDTKKVFADYKVIPTGEKHGTLTVIVDGFPVEITTFRSEEGYTDHRHPDEVRFVNSLEEDLKRRDFTVNAMAYNPEKGIIDLFDGQDDLKKGVIRTVGNSEERFKEDSLRILRAVRFVAKTGFDIEEKTFEAMEALKGDLKNVSVERIFSELTKILCADYAAKALILCKDIVFEVLPELKPMDGFEQKSLSHDYDVYTHTVKALELCKERTPVICWTLLLHDSGKPFTFIVDELGYGHFPKHMPESEKIAKNVLTRLKAPVKFTERVCLLVLNHDRSFDDDEYKIKKFMSLFGEEAFRQLLVVKEADCYAHSAHGIEKYKHCHILSRQTYDKIKQRGDCFYFSEMKLSGGYLSSFGFNGKQIGTVKHKLFELVLKNKIPNDVEALKEKAAFIKQKTDENNG